MKTNLFKTATITLGIVISISVSAQNTKALKVNSFTSKIGNTVKESISNLGEELSNQICMLKSSAQFKPVGNFEYASDAAELVIDLSELETAAKYTPAYSTSEAMEACDDLNNILDELKVAAQYRPNSEFNINEVIILEVSNELAAVIRYKPQS